MSEKKKLIMISASWQKLCHISVGEILAKTEAYLSSFGTIITRLAWKYNCCGESHYAPRK